MCISIHHGNVMNLFEPLLISDYKRMEKLPFEERIMLEINARLIKYGYAQIFFDNSCEEEVYESMLYIRDQYEDAGWLTYVKFIDPLRKIYKNEIVIHHESVNADPRSLH
jgi:hypothetical protein